MERHPRTTVPGEARSAGRVRPAVLVTAAGIAALVGCSVRPPAAGHATGPSGAGAIATVATASAPPADPALGSRVALADGRSYWFAPASGGGKHPLILVLPGLHLDPLRTDRETGISSWARAHHVSVAFAMGIGESWNAGAGCCGVASRKRIDDVAYLRRIVDDARRRARVDLARVAVIGDSAGGMMALRAACAASDVFALGASVGGPLLVPCAHGSLIRVRGNHDRTVPATGGYDSYLQARLPSLAEERRLLGRHARERILVWAGGHRWPHRSDGLDATAVLGAAILRAGDVTRARP